MRLIQMFDLLIGQERIRVSNNSLDKEFSIDEVPYELLNKGVASMKPVLSNDVKDMPIIKFYVTDAIK